MKPRDVEADAHVEGNLAAEVSMVALDTLELVIQVCQIQFDDLLESLCGWRSVRKHTFLLCQNTFISPCGYFPLTYFVGHKLV